ncbi:Cx9C motif-containing protein 4, mitochondrial [Malassezia sp. CBS 17886]|nr:Cx9C motif-containing protein 4, mitochondrial [Malassezia sp. CBS 17886]
MAGAQAEQPAGLEGPNPCKRLACAIQTCLERHRFQQDQCDVLVKGLYECCRAFYSKHGEDARCESCPTPAATRRKLKTWGVVWEEGQK